MTELSGEYFKVIGAGIFSIITASVAYMAATKKFKNTTADSDKSVFVNAVTNERAKWRDELRESIATYCKLSIAACNDDVNLAELCYHKNKIIMRLNPEGWAVNDGHYLDYQVTKAVTEIYKVVDSNTINKIKIKTQVANLEKAGQKLLKQEWEKSKKEAGYNNKEDLNAQC